MARHVGRIELAQETLLRMLRFEGGRIHYIGHIEDKLCIGIVIEHPDMPEVPDGGIIPVVDITVREGGYKRILPKPSLRYRLRTLRETLLGKFRKMKFSSEV